MNDSTKSSSLPRSIAAVERDTGLSKDTLRVWERRYGFPTPGRDAFGERAYPKDQVDKLRVLRRLMDAGHRPGKIIGLPLAQLRALAADVTAAAESGPAPADAESELANLQRYVDLLKTHHVDELRRTLSEAQLRIGMARFVIHVVAPLTRLVGEAWARGQIEVFEEHLYTESMQVVLRSAIGTIPLPSGRPRALLTTVPQESHGLGLLMAEAILSLEGCRCLSLGVQTPVMDIVLAAGAHDADVVALSFSSSVNPNLVLESLAELREKLPETVELWAGGACRILRRRPPEGVIVLPELEDIQAAIGHWRSRHPAG